jgi:hypothetical protein
LFNSLINTNSVTSNDENKFEVRAVLSILKSI